MKIKVLVIATSHKTRGGITSVIEAHKSGEQWEKFHCKWIGTHSDGCSVQKIIYFLFALSRCIFLMPFYDIVHIHLSEVRSARRKKIFVWMAKIMQKKIIIHLHAFSPKTTFERYPRLYLDLFKSADKILVLSKQWQEWIHEYLGYDKNIEILYNPCPNVGVFETIDKKKEILYAGTVNERKGYRDLIRAFALIIRKYPDWKLVIAGNGDIEHGKELAREIFVSDKVLFTGWITGKEKQYYFSSASVFCLPSYAEGFPMAVLDAWAYGLPVVTTPVGGIPDVVVNDKNGLLFKPGDVDNLSIQLDKIISNKELRERIERESIKLSETTFNINTINEQLDVIYTNVFYPVKINAD